MTRLIKIPIPAELAEDMAQVLKDIKQVCPKHGDDGKRIVAIDQCQWELLKLLERIGHGVFWMEFQDGRPSLMRITGSYKFTKERGLEKMDWAREGREKLFEDEGGNIIYLDRHEKSSKE